MAESATRPQQVLTIAVWIAAFITALLGILQTITGHRVLYIGLINLATAAAVLQVPKLRRFRKRGHRDGVRGDRLRIADVCRMANRYRLGVQFYYLVSASLTVLALGVEHLVLAATVVAVGAGLSVMLEFLVPGDTGIQPHWALTTAFIASTVGAS